MLRWSINLFRVFGIQLSVHVSFALLLAYEGYVGWGDGGAEGVAWSIGLTILFFVCVVLHELGHSLTARRFGVRVPRILLMPIGGMAEFDHIPRQSRAELLITAAGPAVNFVIAALLFALCGLPEGWPFNPEYTDSARGLGQLLMTWNLIMGCFNLVPVFPMDGGRILRASLASRMTYLRATFWASLSGKVLSGALALGAALFFQNYLVACLFVFIFFAADAEYRFVLRKEAEANYRAEIARRIAALGDATGMGRSAQLHPACHHGPN